MAPDGDDRPRGRDEVVAALLAAATRLFAERGPAAVSLRDVAAAANVNVGLIHRHIGSKDDLLAAVLRARPGMSTVDAWRPDVEAVMRALLRTVDAATYLRLAGRTILDGYDLAPLQGAFPLIELAAEELGKTLPPDEAAYRAAFLTTMTLGWHLFAHSALGLVGRGDRSIEEAAAAIGPALEAFLTAPPVAGA
jgi:AcrR family transcriptional regulator